MPRFSSFARNLTAESAFTVLAIADSSSLGVRTSSSWRSAIARSPPRRKPSGRASARLRITKPVTVPVRAFLTFARLGSVRHGRIRLLGNDREHRCCLRGQAVRAVLRRGDFGRGRWGLGL